MTKKSAKQTNTDETVSLAAALSKRADFKNFSIWLVGDTPLITHAWSQKAKMAMLGKQIGAVKPGKEARDPHADFVASLYEMGDGSYGFPATGIKNCILSAAHKDKGIPRSVVQSSIWVNADMVRTRPALAGAICDMPLLRIYGSKPEMREDMVRVGAGLNKTATLAYRGQFTVWAVEVSGRFNSSVLSVDQLAFLIQEAGTTFGLGEWRNEKKGVFGAFHLADVNEEAEWNAFKAGTGSMPVPYSYAQAAE